MPAPRFEVPAGAIDGVNTVFTVSVPYKAGTTAVFLNGLLLRADLDDGWTETDPAAGEVTLKEAPRAIGDCPDVVQVFFIDTSPVLPGEVVERLRGRLRLVEALEGRLRQDEALRGSLDAEGALEGRVQPEPALHGTVESEVVLKGRLEAVC